MFPHFEWLHNPNLFATQPASLAVQMQPFQSRRRHDLIKSICCPQRVGVRDRDIKFICLKFRIEWADEDDK